MRPSRPRCIHARVILVHGGCGATAPTSTQLEFLRRAVDRGHRILAARGSALDAVEAAVVVLERSGRFNAGKGSHRQMDGVARMDASVMNGRDLSAGAVAAVEGILTPIRAARCVMERTPHVVLVGDSARHLARLHGVAALTSAATPGKPVNDATWRTLYHEVTGTSRVSVRDTRGLETPDTFGTVGAVARDAAGHVAAATSTGGITRMLPGRVGDTPCIGAGTYADDRSGAVSMTGTGEVILRGGLAKDIIHGLEHGRSPTDAGAESLIKVIGRIGGDAGAIIVSSIGEFAIVHTTAYMASGYCFGRNVRVVAHGRRLYANSASPREEAHGKPSGR